MLRLIALQLRNVLLVHVVLAHKRQVRGTAHMPDAAPFSAPPPPPCKTLCTLPPPLPARRLHHRYSQHVVHCPDCRQALNFIDTALPVARTLATSAVLVGVLMGLGTYYGGGAAALPAALLMGCVLLAAASALAGNVLQWFRTKLTWEDYIHAWRD